MAPELLTVNDLAVLFDVHRETIIRWADQGLIPVVYLPSGGRRFRRADVDAFLVPTDRPRRVG